MFVITRAQALFGATALSCLVVVSVALAGPTGDSGDPQGTASASVKKKIKKLKKRVKTNEQRLAELEDEQGGARPPSGPAGGDLTGSYPNPLIGPNTVGTSEVDGSLGQSDLAAGAVASSEILNGSVGTADQAATPAARVSGSVSDVPKDTAFTHVEFSSDTTSGNFDPFNMWVPGDPENVTAPVAGTYMATGLVRWENDFSSALMSGLQDNGLRLLQVSGTGNQDARSVVPPSRFGTEQTGQQSTAIMQLEPGEQVSMQVAQDNDDDSDIDAVEARLAVAWIGPA